MKNIPLIALTALLLAPLAAPHAVEHGQAAGPGDSVTASASKSTISEP